MDLRSMSDTKFTSYRKKFFTEIKDWTPSVVAEADTLIQESNLRLAKKRLQIKKPGGLDKRLADDLLEKIATSSPLKARSRGRKKRRTKRTRLKCLPGMSAATCSAHQLMKKEKIKAEKERKAKIEAKKPRKSMRRKSKRLVGGMLKKGREKKKKVGFAQGRSFLEIASAERSGGGCMRCSGNPTVCQEMSLPGFKTNEDGSVWRTIDGKVMNESGVLVEDPRRCQEEMFWGVDDDGKPYERQRECCSVVESED